jgi:hypothetical protein
MLRLDRGRRWTPLYMRTDDGTVLAQRWAAGFMFAVQSFQGTPPVTAAYRGAGKPVLCPYGRS